MLLYSGLLHPRMPEYLLGNYRNYNVPSHCEEGLEHLTYKIIKILCNSIVRENRLCKLCNQNVIENEYHFMLCCSKYRNLRIKCHCNVSWSNKNIFNSFMTTLNKKKMYNIAKYIKDIFVLRNNILNAWSNVIVKLYKYNVYMFVYSVLYVCHCHICLCKYGQMHFLCRLPINFETLNFKRTELFKAPFWDII